MEGELTSRDLLPFIIEMMDWICAFEGEVPAAKPGECGNYLDHNLDMCKYECALYAKVLKNATDENLIYPS
jgi:S-ribosylhomocysteine lyase